MKPPIDYFDFYERHVVGLKKTGPNNAKGRCPLGNHTDSNPSFSVFLDEGNFNCFGCKETGSYETFKKRMEVENPMEGGFKWAEPKLSPSPSSFIPPLQPTEFIRGEIENRDLENKKADSLLSGLIETCKTDYGKTINWDTVARFKISAYSYFNSNLGKEIECLRVPAVASFQKRLEVNNPEAGKVRWKCPSKKSQPDSAGGSYIGNLAPGDTMVFITEGEWDAFSLHEHLGERNGSILSISGGSAVVPKDFEILKDRTVVLCYDFDEAGQKGALAHAHKLCGVAKEVIILDWERSDLVFGDKTKKDICDFFSMGKSPSDFWNLVKRSKPYRQVDDQATLRERSVGMKSRELSNEVIRTLASRGDFIKVGFGEGLQYYWFDMASLSLYPVDKCSSVFRDLLNSTFGINAASDKYSETIFNLHAHIRGTGKETSIHRSTWYDRESNLLYIYNNRKAIYRLDGTGIRSVKNGDEGVYFAEPAGNEEVLPLEIKYDPSLAESGAFAKHLLEIPNFSGESRLGAGGQRLMYHKYIHSLFFEPLQNALVSVIFKGQQGSGKSFCQKILLFLYYGSPLNPKALPEETRDLHTALFHNKVSHFDNVDTKISDKIQDAIACAATGARQEERLYHTNGAMFSRQYKTFMGFSTRTDLSVKGCVFRPDVLDRSLLFFLDVFSPSLRSRRSESEMISDFRNDFSAIWSGLMHELNECVHAIGANRNQPIPKFNFRMKDFADFCLLTCKTDEERMDFLQIIQEMNISQVEAGMEDNLVFTAFRLLQDTHDCLIQNPSHTLLLTRDALHKDLLGRLLSAGYAQSEGDLMKNGFPSRVGFVKFLKKHKALFSPLFQIFEISDDRDPLFTIQFHPRREAA